MASGYRTSCLQTMYADDTEEFIPRCYQEELLKIAKENNTILYLPTGSGKTYIAVMLIKEMGYDIDSDYNDGAKRTVFLVNTVALVDQQAKYLSKFTPFKIGAYSGDCQCDMWNKEKWYEELRKYNVLVMTAQILLNMVQHGYFDLERCNLLIFDECHHGVADHPMRQIMQQFETIDLNNSPKILGLTATLLNRNVKPFQVLEEVKLLERTYRSKIATVEALNIVLGYSTNPQEKIINFSAHQTSEKEVEIIGMLQNLQDIVRNMNFPKNTDNYEKFKFNDYILIEDQDSNKKITNIIDDIIDQIRNGGLFGGSKAVLSQIIHFERLCKHAQDALVARFMQIIITTLTAALKLMEDVMNGVDELNRVLKFSSTKILCLLETLIQLRQEQASDIRPFCGIVFVQRRFTAKVLYHVFKAIKRCHPDFNFLKPEFLVGFNNNPYNDTREAIFERKQSMEVLEQFKRLEINILFATNVIEEGLDVPNCTMVTMYDLPTTYSSYIQSKGRARHRDSKYLMMCPANDSKFKTRYLQYQEVEKILQDMLVNNQRIFSLGPEIASTFDIDENEFYEVPSTGANVTLASAIALVNRYCLSLPQDKFTILAPVWYRNTPSSNHQLPYNKVRVFLQLPTVSPVREEIISPYMSNLKDAKRTAALMTIRALHIKGQLNDHLLPVTIDKLLQDTEFIFKNWQNEATETVDGKTIVIPGTKTKRRRYSKKNPEALCESCPEPNNSAYLHVIEFIPAFSEPTCTNACKTKFYRCLKSRKTYALLTSKKLPPICDFPIYLSCGEINVHITINQTIDSLSSDDLTTLKRFHSFIFACVLKILKPFLIFDNLNEANSYLVVPVCTNNESRYEIDMEIARSYYTLPEVEEPTLQTKRNISVTDNDYLDSVVYPWYRNRDTAYLVCEVTHKLNSLSPFPHSNFSNYAKYYHDKWNLSIENPTQPLLLVKALPNRLNCLKPRGEGRNSFKRKTQEDDDFEEHFIPELCIKMPYPSVLWLKAKCIPAILHRIHYLLLADELRRQINSQTGIPSLRQSWSPLKVEKFLLNSNYNDQDRGIDEVENIVSGRASPVAEKLDMKKLEFQQQLADNVQYPWKDEQEPVDIERNIETVTLFEIEYYDKFVSQKNLDLSLPDGCITPVASPTQRAITFERPEKEIQIKILEKKRVDDGPELCDIYQAITTAQANDVVNLERFETLGDSFLKFGATLYLYLKFPEWNEGNLTTIKGRIVGNRNLFYCGSKKELGNIMKMSDFEPNSDWFPPKFCIPRILDSILKDNDISSSVFYNFNIPLNEQKNGILSKEIQKEIIEVIHNSINDTLQLTSSMEDYLGQQIVNDKSIADCVEALLGCYLCSNGVDGAFALLQWFGILPEEDNPSMLMYQQIPSPYLKITKKLDEKEITEQVRRHLPNCHELEKTLNYSFKNKAFLLQALTHPSYNINRITDCYQRLEFIGDAVLDFLITCYIYEQCGKNMTAGNITDLRSALVNNVVFASLSVKYNFHKYLLLLNPKLTDVILNFAAHQEKQNHVINEEVLILLEESDVDLVEYVDVPKMLGDVFESIIGAIYLDSNMNLKQVWEVVYSLMKKEIEEFSENIPKNPVRMLYEATTASPRFGIQNQLEDGTMMIPLTFYLDGKKKLVYGFGENKKKAKRAAAKIAVRAIYSNKKIDEIIS